MKKLVWIFLTALGAAFLLAPHVTRACCLDKPAAASAAGADVGTAADSVCTLKVEGMTCAGCAGPVEKAATSVAGVSRAEVSFQQGKAVVYYRSDNATPEAIAGAVSKAGFPSSVESQ